MGWMASSTGGGWEREREDATPAMVAVPRVIMPAPPARSSAPFGQAPSGGVIITRNRCIHLRTVTPRDLDHLSRWSEDMHLARMVGSELLQLYKDVYDKDESFFDALLSDPTQIVLIVMANDGTPEPVGMVRLFNIHQSEGYAGIETILADRRPRWRGYGVQASRLMAYYGADVLGLRRIEAKAYEYNPLSVNTLKRNGFTHEGTLRKASWRDGRYWDILVFGILREELEEQRAKDRYLLPRGGLGELSEPS